MTIPAAFRDALAVLLPVRCAGCGEPDRALCANCQRELVAKPELLFLEALPMVASALRYEGVARRVILEFKEQGRSDVAATLALALMAALVEVISVTGVTGDVELVTVPSSRSALRRRGFEPVALLFRRQRVFIGGSVLQRVRQTENQKSLDRIQRGTNLIGSLRARGSLAGRTFVLVDDVVTTGATLREVARAVEEAGGFVAGVATLAWAPRRCGPV